MGRTVLNKHYDSAANITADKFFNRGEIIISNEVGNEGIYIINTRGDVVKIGYKGGSESGGTIPGGDYITGQDLRDYLQNQAYMTSADTAELLSSIEVAISELNNRIDNMVITSGGVVDLSDLYTKVNAISATTEEHIGRSEREFQSIEDRIDALSGLTAEILTEEQVRDIVIGEISFLVSSADTMFDTLRGLADWIANDETGSAQLIADVTNLKDAVSGVTDRVSTLEDRVDSIEGGLSELSAETESLKDLVENLPIPSGSPVDESVIQALKDYIDEKIASIQHENDHVFLSRSQYYELIANGSVVIDGKVHEYSDDIYYCIYDEQVPPTSGDSSYEYDEETGMIVISGNTEVSDGILELAGAVLDSDGFVTINNVEPTPSDEPEVDEEGLVDVSNLPVDEDGLVELPNNWEIIE